MNDLVRHYKMLARLRRERDELRAEVKRLRSELEGTP